MDTADHACHHLLSGSSFHCGPTVSQTPPGKASVSQGFWENLAGFSEPCGISSSSEASLLSLLLR